MSTTTSPQGASDPAQEPAAGDALAAWAESQVEINPEGPRSRFAEPGDEAGRAMLEEALGGPAALRGALGGRPTLDPSGAGGVSGSPRAPGQRLTSCDPLARSVGRREQRGTGPGAPAARRG